MLFCNYDNIDLYAPWTPEGGPLDMSMYMYVRCVYAY